MTQSERIKKITALLKRDYPTVKTPLYHETAFQLVCAVLMSAQTLDASVNKVTPILFAKYPTAKDLSKADSLEVEKIIKSLNYHKTKSKHLVQMAQKLLTDFNGIVPNNIEKLTTLPGVGRKTANVVVSEWFAMPISNRGNWPIEPLPEYIEINNQINDPVILPEGFVVDTHVIRTSNRLGLTTYKDPKKIEQDLMKVFPQNEWNEMSLRLIFHGRYRCKARDNQCCKDPDWKELCDCG